MRALAAVLPLALALVACEGGGDPVTQALREEAAANHAEVALAREAQAARRAAEADAEQAEIARLRREILVAEAARDGADDPELRTAAEESLAASQAALARLEPQT